MPPDVLLVLVFGSVCGALCHIVFRGRRLRQLLTALVIGIAGFALGHVAGRLANLGLTTIGPLHAIEGFAVSSVTLLVARWLKL
jgi:uncharacterized membrane protein YeaQ/YmgE (transglycosylase-associated protein family)